MEETGRHNESIAVIGSLLNKERDAKGTEISVELHDAYVRGDLTAVKTLLGDPSDFPNCIGPRGCGEIILEYAIYWSSLPFIKKLLELKANPNYDDPAGFPSLVAALSTTRSDKLAIMELLLAFGADIEQRGVNDWTPLHWAAARGDERGVALLLGHGANPEARTSIDDLTTPLEEAERAGQENTAALLRKFTQG